MRLGETILKATCPKCGFSKTRKWWRQHPGTDCPKCHTSGMKFISEQFHRCDRCGRALHPKIGPRCEHCGGVYFSADITVGLLDFLGHITGLKALGIYKYEGP